MIRALRPLLLVLLGFFVLVAQSTVETVVALYPLTPNAMLPLVLYLGATNEVPLLRGAVQSFFLGYLLDLFSGNLLGLHTFLSVATFMLVRGVGLRVVMRNIGTMVSLTATVALVFGGATLALRAIFEHGAPFPTRDDTSTVTALVGSSLATGLLSPLLLSAARAVDSTSGARREEVAG